MYAVVIAGLCGLSACVDGTSSTGAQGRLEYTLYTDYDVAEVDLRDAQIVTGHEQRLIVQWTAQGRREVTDSQRVQHVVVPDDGVTVFSESGSESVPPDVRILVDAPGTYRLESRLAGELIDYTELTFAALDGFDLLSQVRAPWSDAFDLTSGADIPVEEGSQVTFQPVPLDGQGKRLLGDLETSLSVDPEWAVVPGVGVVDAYENGVWTVHGEADFYFIEPASVTFTVTDDVNGVSSEQRFTVTPVARP